MFELDSGYLHLITAALAGADGSSDTAHASVGEVHLVIEPGREVDGDSRSERVLPEQPLAGVLLAAIASRAVAAGDRHVDLSSDLPSLAEWARTEMGASADDLWVQLRRLGAARYRFVFPDSSLALVDRRVEVVHLFDEMDEAGSVTLSKRFFDDITASFVGGSLPGSMG